MACMLGQVIRCQVRISLNRFYAFPASHFLQRRKRNTSQPFYIFIKSRKRQFPRSAHFNHASGSVEISTPLSPCWFLILLMSAFSGLFTTVNLVAMEC